VSRAGQFHDHFSGHAEDYARYRPTYPPELFAWLASQCTGRSVAWDCATGNGQALPGLSRWFDFVVGTDASIEQLKAAGSRRSVGVACGLAERRILGQDTIDCVTIAQALHWLDRPAFFEIVREVARPRCIIAAWTYSDSRVSEEVDLVVADFNRMLHGGYWSPERRHVDTGYASIDFPFEEFRAPAFVLRASWTLEQYRGYILTWSASRAFGRQEGSAALEEWMNKLERAWGDVSRREVAWPLSIRAGHVHPEAT
jgi:ubiquinone/menaquinone biosynthesis C-methylase UbiE